MLSKIICTIGPASNSAAVMGKMMQAGMSIARFNFSHGNHSEHRRAMDLIRRLNRKYRRRTKILQDLAGFRIRVGKFKANKPVQLKKYHQVLLTNAPVPGTDKIIPFDYKGSLRDIKPGSHIYIDDGNIALRVLSQRARYLKADVIRPGLLTEHKGMNIPDVELPFKGITAKDHADLLFGISRKVDYVAQSFVRNKNDILSIRRLLREHGADCQIIAKIENRQGIKNIDEIIRVSDGIMIARGDMGVSISIHKIPVVQKEIIKKCNRAGKPVITATQMLESMVEHYMPTRAEVTDVANAVLDGTDYVMLSAESAAGLFPVEAAKMMKRIISFTGRYQKTLQAHKQLDWRLLWTED